MPRVVLQEYKSSRHGYASLTQKFRVRVWKFSELSKVSGRNTNAVPAHVLAPGYFKRTYTYPSSCATGVQNSQTFWARVIPGKIPWTWFCTYPTEHNLEGSMTTVQLLQVKMLNILFFCRYSLLPAAYDSAIQWQQGGTEMSLKTLQLVAISHCYNYNAHRYNYSARPATF